MLHLLDFTMLCTDRKVHDLLEFMVGDLATEDQIRVAAQAATEEDGHRHAQYVSEHADDPECVKAAVEVQQSLPEVQGKIQELFFCSLANGVELEHPTLKFVLALDP